MWKLSNKKIKIDTYIAPSTHIEGNIITDTPMKIDGRVTGDINTIADVIIGEQACITGDLTAKDVIINGTINGNVFSFETVTLTEDGKVNGDIRTTGLIVDNGCQFHGNCVIIDQMEASDLPLEIEEQIQNTEPQAEMMTDATAE